MNWIMLFVAYTLGAMTMFAMFCLGYMAKIKEPMNVNRVHFYVARDKNENLWLYIGKPIRGDDMFYVDLSKGSIGITCHKFKPFGLNENDYKDLKWEDEPVEVFVNMED